MKPKKSVKQKVSEYSYNKPSMDKRFLEIKKGVSQISSMLNEKDKKTK